MNYKSTYLEKNHLKWAVIFALFLSLFTFSNNQASSITLRSNPVIQTEWVYRTHINFTPLSTIRKAIRKTGVSIKEFFKRIFIFNKILIVKLIKLTEAFLGISATSSFFIQEAASQYPPEIPAH